MKNPKGTLDLGGSAPLRRHSGLLLHPTSLPGPGPIGTLGPAASAFIDWLAEARQGCWQMLPTGPTPGHGSPYSALSAFAGNTWLLAHEPLLEAGWLSAEGGERAGAKPGGPADRVDFAAAERRAEALVGEAWPGFQRSASPADREALDAFREGESAWLEDYALFRALRRHHDDRSWVDWPADLARREPGVLAAARQELGQAIDHEVFGQFLFERQWADLARRARERGVQLIGDIPIYVAHDSAEVWASQDLYELDESGRPIYVAGVPPDYFSETGQRWGNPLYDWERMAERGYAWWVARFERLYSHFDVVRIDHFRGFEAYWRIPASEPTAVAGEWVDGPRDALFRTVEQALGGPLGVIAEDLGLIDDGVRALRHRLGFPGMAVLQFAFYGDPEHPYLPENARRRQVTYPGTHDNDTTRGWYDALSEGDRAHVEDYFGGPLEEPAWALIEAAWRCRAYLSIAQVQDVLSLGTEARFNTPGEPEGNWLWRLPSWDGLAATGERLARLTEEAGRARRGL